MDRITSPREGSASPCVPLVKEGNLFYNFSVDILADLLARLGSSFNMSLQGAMSCHDNPDHSCVTLLAEKGIASTSKEDICNGHGRQPTYAIWK